jgi:pimeloyl-ACP methyl ester carboxylesterase
VKPLAVLSFAIIVSTLSSPAEPASMSIPGESVDQWHGHTRRHFTVDGCPAWIVEPKQPLPGKQWVWCMEFPDAFADRCAAPQLLAAGFHHLHIKVGNTFGSPAALRRFDAFYEVVAKAGLAKRGTLIGLSRGGLYAYRWAAEHPDRVNVIYGDAPVSDFKSWPGGKGKGKGSPADWAALVQCYGFKDETEALAYPGNPIDRLDPLARAKIAIIHVVGDADDVVPVAENTAIVEERYRKLGGEIRVIHKPGVGHHPHGLEDCSAVVDWVKAHTPLPDGEAPPAE